MKKLSSFLLFSKGFSVCSCNGTRLNEGLTLQSYYEEKIAEWGVLNFYYISIVLLQFFFFILYGDFVIDNKLQYLLIKIEVWENLWYNMQNRELQKSDGL